MYFIGIDFGHGETTVSRVPGYNGLPVSQMSIKQSNDEADKKIISAICKKNGEWSLVYGEEDFRSDDIREGFKARISTLSETDRESMKEFAKLVFKAILDNDDDLYFNSNEDRNFELGIACPSDWIREDPNSQQEYLDFFRQECEIPVDHCIKESDAAFYTKFSKYKSSENIFVIDLGSSTIDFTTYADCKCVDSCCWGANLGAHHIDDALMADILGKGENADNIKILKEFKEENGYYGDVESAISLFVRTTKERYYAEKRLAYSLGIRYDQLTPGWSEMKICLGYSASKTVYEEVISSYTNKIKEILIKAKKQLDSNNISIHRVMLSGGASKMPFIKDLSSKIFNVPIDLDQQPQCVVSNGIALYAEDQKKSLDLFSSKIKILNYEELYKDADKQAILKATKELFPPVLKDILGTTDYSGKDLFFKIANFFYGLDSNNTEYKRILNNHVNMQLTDIVSNAIKSAIKNVYGIDRTPNVSINIDVSVMNFNPDFFTQGKGGQTIISILEDATGPHVFTSFDVDRPRGLQQRKSIVDTCISRLLVVDPFGPLTYEKKDLEVIAANIKEQAINEAYKVFYNEQLFRTTFSI